MIKQNWKKCVIPKGRKKERPDASPSIGGPKKRIRKD